MENTNEQPEKKAPGKNYRYTVKQRKFIKYKVMGDTNIGAYENAGYKINPKRSVAYTNATNLKKKPKIQQAIDEALEKLGLTPEWAVEQLAKVAAQDDELGSKRLASKDLLELHGWKKGDRPTMALQINSNFFGGGRELESDQEQETNIVDL